MYSSNTDCQREPIRPMHDVTTPGYFKALTGTAKANRLADPYNKLKSIIGDTPFWIAGGAITSIMTDDVINDWDIFTSDWKYVVRSLNNVGATITGENSHIINYLHDSIPGKIQIIKKVFASPLRTAESIDFTINAAAYDGIALYVHEDFVQDIEDHKINLNVVKYPFSSLKRVVKYAGRGFTPGPQTLVTLVDMIRKANVVDLSNETFYLDSD